MIVTKFYRFNQFSFFIWQRITWITLHNLKQFFIFGRSLKRSFTWVKKHLISVKGTTCFLISAARPLTCSTSSGKYKCLIRTSNYLINRSVNVPQQSGIHTLLDSEPGLALQILTLLCIVQLGYLLPIKWKLQYGSMIYNI